MKNKKEIQEIFNKLYDLNTSLNKDKKTLELIEIKKAQLKNLQEEVKEQTKHFKKIEKLYETISKKLFKGKDWFTCREEGTYDCLCCGFSNGDYKFSIWKEKQEEKINELKEEIEIFTGILEGEE